MRLFFSITEDYHDMTIFLGAVSLSPFNFNKDEPVAYVDLEDDEVFCPKFELIDGQLYDHYNKVTYPYFQGKIYRYASIADEFLSETISGFYLNIYHYCNSNNIEYEIEDFDIYENGQLVKSDFNERCNEVRDKLSKVFKKDEYYV